MAKQPEHEPFLPPTAKRNVVCTFGWTSCTQIARKKRVTGQSCCPLGAFKAFQSVRQHLETRFLTHNPIHPWTAALWGFQPGCKPKSFWWKKSSMGQLHGGEGRELRPQRPGSPTSPCGSGAWESGDAVACCARGCHLIFQAFWSILKMRWWSNELRLATFGMGWNWAEISFDPLPSSCVLVSSKREADMGAGRFFSFPHNLLLLSSESTSRTLLQLQDGSLHWKCEKCDIPATKAVSSNKNIACDSNTSNFQSKIRSKDHPGRFFFFLCFIRASHSSVLGQHGQPGIRIQQNRWGHFSYWICFAALASVLLVAARS